MTSSNPWLMVFSTLVLLILILTYRFLTKRNDYWEKRKVPFLKPTLFFGSFFDRVIGRESRFDYIIRVYNEFEGKRFGGLFVFREPALLVRDIDLIEKILKTDFEHFYDRPTPVNFNNKLTETLFSAKGAEWRDMRRRLLQAFTSVKLKGMLEQMVNCGDNIVQNIAQTGQQGDLDVLSWTFKYSNDIISSCAFGFQEPVNESERKLFLKNVTEKVRNFTRRYLTYGLGTMFPQVVQLLGLRYYPKWLDEYFMDLARANVQYRRDNKIERNDFLHCLLTLKDQEEKGEEVESAKHTSKEDALVDQLSYAPSLETEKKVKVFTEELIASFLFTFLSVGSESVANTLGFCLLELARYPEVQTRLRAEVNVVLTRHGGWTYQAIKDMHYLDLVIQETLRLHSVAAMARRVVTSPWRLPGTDLVLEPGLQVIIPIAALHRDPDYYPEPHRFLPERFLQKHYRPSSTFLPFGNGPRICIAMQFAILELKVCIAKIVRRFSFTASERTVCPLRMDPAWFFPRPVGSIWLRFRQEVQSEEMTAGKHLLFDLFVNCNKTTDLDWGNYLLHHCF